MTRRRVVVTGLGCISPVGNTVGQAWSRLLAGQSGIDRITKFDASTFSCQIAGEVRGFEVEAYMSAKEARTMDTFIHYGIAAASQAVADAGLKTGEALGEETFAWGRETFGLAINEFYGQTECNLVVASAASIGVSRPGSMGKPVPGHDVRIIRPDGSFCEPGELGQVAVRRPDPVMFLQYWNRPEATEQKFIGDWMTTGDQAQVDEDGYIHFVGRDDDVITSSGYRIGPGEIEDCLIQHEAVLLAAAVGQPDELRTEIIKAFLVLKPGYGESEALKKDIQAFVRTRLSAHEYPREIEFIAEMPLTTTGKVIRRLLRDRG